MEGHARLLRDLQHFVSARFPTASQSRWHGANHWDRVLFNAEVLAKDDHTRLSSEECAALVIFSQLHDAARRNDDVDPLHGFRGATAASVFFHQFPHHDLHPQLRQALREAIAWHSEGRIHHAHPVVRLCWDADRIDLVRVGILPDPSRMCTPAGARWARRLSEKG